MSGWHEILGPIGWDDLHEVSPLYALQLAAKLNSRGGAVSNNPAEARTQARDIEALARRVFDMWSELGDLPPDIRDMVNRGAHAVGAHTEFLDGIAAPDAIEQARSALWSVLSGLEPLMNKLEREGSQSPRGRPANLAAREVGGVVAEIHLFRHGRLPTLGRRPDGDGLTGEYGVTFEATLAALDIACADPFRPAREAIDALEGDDVRVDCLLRLRDPELQHSVQIHLRKL